MPQAMKKKVPDIIISCLIGSHKTYVFSAPFGPNNRRHPQRVNDIEKAARFWSEESAQRFIDRFLPDGRQYTTEPYQPAVQKNEAKEEVYA
jgi:hypothetical protein